MNVRVEFLNIVEPANDAGRMGSISGNVEIVSVDGNTTPKSIVWTSIKTSTMERNCCCPLCYSHENLAYRTRRPLVCHLGQCSSHLIAGAASVNVKRFIVVRVGKEAITHH